MLVHTKSVDDTQYLMMSRCHKIDDAIEFSARAFTSHVLTKYCCCSIFTFSLYQNAKLSSETHFSLKPFAASSCFACIILMGLQALHSRSLVSAKVNKLNMNILLTFTSAQVKIDCARTRPKRMAKNVRP